MIGWLKRMLETSTAPFWKEERLSTKSAEQKMMLSVALFLQAAPCCCRQSPHGKQLKKDAALRKKHQVDMGPKWLFLNWFIKSCFLLLSRSFLFRSSFQLRRPRWYSTGEWCHCGERWGDDVFFVWLDFCLCLCFHVNDSWGWRQYIYGLSIHPSIHPFVCLSQPLVYIWWLCRLWLSEVKGQGYCVLTSLLWLSVS